MSDSRIPLCLRAATPRTHSSTSSMSCGSGRFSMSTWVVSPPVIYPVSGLNRLRWRSVPNSPGRFESRAWLPSRIAGSVSSIGLFSVGIECGSSSGSSSSVVPQRIVVVSRSKLNATISLGLFGSTRSGSPALLLSFGSPC